MTIPKYILLAWCALSMFVTINAIGKPREPLTANIAAISVGLTAVVAWLVVIA